jgi:hypothetical protein
MMPRKLIITMGLVGTSTFYVLSIKRKVASMSHEEILGLLLGPIPSSRRFL